MLAGFIGLQSASGRQLPFDEDYFPDATVRKWLQDLYPAAISNGMVETDKVTSIDALVTLNSGKGWTYVNDVEDLSCLRYFTKASIGTLTLNYNTLKKLKRINVSGLTSITKITNNISFTANTNTRAMNAFPIEEIIADGCVNMTEFVFNNCTTLNKVSVKGCTKLLGFYCGYNNYTTSTANYNKVLTSIDLSDARDIQYVYVARNSALKTLRLASSGRANPAAASLIMQCSECALEELDLRNFYTSGSTAYKVTVNPQSNRIRRILFNPDATYYFASFTYTKNALTDMPWKLAYTVSTLSSSCTQTRNVGPDDVVELSEANMAGSFSSVTGGTCSKGSPSTFTFTNASTTTGKYTYMPQAYATTTNNNLKFTCTLTRKKPVQMWIVGPFNGWMPNQDGEWTEPGDWVITKNQYELQYAGGDIYKLTFNGNLQGDYKILVSDPNTSATYMLGAGHHDLVTPYNARGGVDYSNDKSMRYASDDEDGYNLFDVNSEPTSTYDNFHYVAHIRNNGTPLSVHKDSEYAFSTHPCESMGQATMHVNPEIAVSYVSGNETGSVVHGGGGTGDGGTVGIGSSFTDNDSDTAEQWFNLQGMRIDSEKPAPGVYIVRKGNKTHKIIVR